MDHPAKTASPCDLGTLHSGWLSFGDMMTGLVTTDTARPEGAAGWLRGLIRRLAGPSCRERDLSEMPAYLLADMGLDPRDARPEPKPTASSDAAAWIAIKSGVHPRM
jgi:hypothetical protein